MLTIAQLRQPQTRAESVSTLVEIIQELGFETTGWQDGRIQKTLVMGFGWLASEFTNVVRDMVEFGFNDYATGEALTLFSKSRYQNNRARAIKTAGPARLRSTAQSPYTIDVGQLIASTDDGTEFRNTTGGTLSAGSSIAPSYLTLQWEARLAGSAGNVGGSAINRLITSLAGVTVANDVGTPWYTTAGADEQSDPALRQQNATKWASLSVEAVRDSLIYLTLALGIGAEKVFIDDQNPRGPGTVDVYASGATAVLGDSQMQTLQTALAARLFQTATTWLSDWTGSTTRAAARKPATQTLTPTGYAYHDPNVTSAEMKQRIIKALNLFLAQTPLGGWDFSPGPKNVITYADLEATLKGVEGMRTLVLATPSSDVVVGANTLVVLGSVDGLVRTPVAV
jgi:uncharacterized phage protein gp47/JayE